MPRKCITCNLKQPNLKYKGEKQAVYCKSRKLDDMIDVKHKRCIHPNCKMHPIFNYIGIKTPLYCGHHKLKDMVNLKSAMCNNPTCKKQAKYNFKDKNGGKFCVSHKLTDMINVVSKKCDYPNCYTRPAYNTFYSTVGKFCQIHKEPDMVDVVNKKCEYDDCSIKASYNTKGSKKGRYCFSHKLEYMVNVKSKTCKLCDTQVSRNKYEGYCLRCFIHTFPDKPVSRNYKTKEKTVTDYILSTFPEYDWITDKKIQDGCSSRRPDMLLDLGYQVIIIEIDETHHKDYDCSCENKRIMELSKDVNHRPIVFIRFNPDQYIDSDNNTVKSCWYINKLGICSIEKKKEKEWNDRLVSLKSQIKYWCNPNNTTDKTIEIIQLYYDQNKEDISEEETEESESEEEINENIKITQPKIYSNQMI